VVVGAFGKHWPALQGLDPSLRAHLAGKTKECPLLPDDRLLPRLASPVEAGPEPSIEGGGATGDRRESKRRKAERVPGAPRQRKRPRGGTVVTRVWSDPLPTARPGVRCDRRGPRDHPDAGAGRQAEETLAQLRLDRRSRGDADARTPSTRGVVSTAGAQCRLAFRCRYEPESDPARRLRPGRVQQQVEARGQQVCATRSSYSSC
jgi:hypothetical protein